MPELRGTIRIFNGSFTVYADFLIYKNSVLFARNGSGKTTFLKGIAGLLRSEGELRLSGKRVDGLPPEKRGIVYVNQNPEFPITVKKFANIMKCEDGLSELVPNLSELASRKISQLSLGQRQRVVTACVVLSNRKHEVVLLDESVDNISDRLDFLKAVLSEAESRGRLIVYATNNSSGVEMFKQFFTLRDGKLLEVENYSSFLT